MIAQQHTSLPSLTDLQAAALALYLDAQTLLNIAIKLNLPFHKLIDLFNEPELKAYTNATLQLAKQQLELQQTSAKLIAIETLTQIAADKTINQQERRRAATTILRPTPTPRATSHARAESRDNSASQSQSQSASSSLLPRACGGGGGGDRVGGWSEVGGGPNPPVPSQSQLKTENQQLKTPLPPTTFLTSPTLQSATDLHQHLSPKLKRRLKTPKALLNHFKNSNLRELLNCTAAEPDQTRGTTQTYKITTAKGEQKTLTIKLTRSPTNKTNQLYIDEFKIDSS